MYEVIILFVLALVWVIFASVQDLRKREVANWINFSLIFFALGFRLFYSLFSDIGWSFFLQGVFGFAIFFIIGNVFYYSRVFAGGDAKLMIAFGAILGVSSNFSDNVKLYSLFLFLFFFVGAIYGLMVMIFLSAKNFKKFKKEFSLIFSKNKIKVSLGVFVAIIFIILGFSNSTFFVAGIIIFLFPYLYIYAKSVDNVCMVKIVKSKDLTEGDWLYEGVKIGRNSIKPSWEGLNKKEILLIKKKMKYVKIKQGIPFVPVFLISLIIFFYLWKTGLLNVFW